MNYASTPVFMRSEVRAEIVKRIRDAVPKGENIAVSRGFPGSALQERHIYLGTPTGDVSNEVFTGQLLTYDDQFECTVVIADATGGMSSDVAEQSTQDLGNLVYTALIDASLGNLVMLNGAGFMIEALIGRVDGPHAEIRVEGYIGLMTIDLMFHTRTKGK